MCGIFVSLGNINKHINVQNFLNIQTHRGPDNNSFKKFENLTLGSNRLKILDITNQANMPFKYGSITLCFNGFISNYRKLKLELINRGLNFKTSCDTEVLVAMLNAYSLEECVKKIEGMWAFIAYDEKKEELLVSRDDYGIKPLYYYQNYDSLVFASEINTIKGLSKEVDPSNLKKFVFIDGISNSHSSSSKTLYKNIFQFPINSYCKINLNKRKYTDFSVYKIKRDKQDKITNKFDFFELLNKKFDEYSAADVKKCVPLSGGIDSNIIASYYKNDNQTKFYSIDQSNKRTNYDEGSLIRKIIKNLNHEFIDIDKVVDFNFFKKVTNQLSSPINSTVILNAAALRKTASDENIKVLYSGNGADEIFGGYQSQLEILSRYNLRNKNYIKFFHNFLSSGYLFSPNKTPNNNIKDYLNGLRYFTKSIFNNSLKKYDKTNSINKKFVNFDLSENPNEQNSLLDFNDPWKFNLHLINTRMQYWLQTDDIVSSMFSIENRVPFLNQSIVNQAENFYRLDSFNQVSKSLLRNLYKNKLNYNVLNMKKKLNQPGNTTSFIFDKFYDQCFSALEQGSLFNKKILDEFEKRKNLYDKFKNTKKFKNVYLNDSFLFRAISLNIYHNTI